MNLCGLNISCRSNDLIFEKLSQKTKPAILVTVNAEAIVRAQSDKRLLAIINENLASIDGQIPLWLYRLSHRKSKIEKISGSDLIYKIPQYAEENGLSIFLLGGNEDSNKGSIDVLRSLYPKLRIDGYSPEFQPYPFNQTTVDTITQKLSEFKPDIIFAGFGMGKQEYWEDDNKELFDSLGTRLIVGCGGSFDFASGKIKRAPKAIQNAGLEGFWRLAKEFKWFRLRRILLSTKIFYYYYQHHIKNH